MNYEIIWAEECGDPSSPWVLCSNSAPIYINLSLNFGLDFGLGFTWGLGCGATIFVCTLAFSSIVVCTLGESFNIKISGEKV